MFANYMKAFLVVWVALQDQRKSISGGSVMFAQLCELIGCRNLKSILCLAICSVISVAAMADPQARLTASRTSGPAPLAVFFDATATTDSDTSIDTFRQLGYYFDFDDSGSGVWQQSGLSKNVETGAPLAAHVFDRPGTYRVGVRARNANGSWSDAWVTITVADPNEFYAGTDTVVLSTGSDLTGAPAGAQQLRNVSSWPNWQSNKRYLLKAGDNFSGLGQLRIRDRNDFQVGRFGLGSKPIVSSVLIDMDEDNAATPPENGVIQDLDTDVITQYKMFKNLLLYRNDVIGDSSNINFAAANTWYANNQRGTSSAADWKHSGPIFIVENHVNMNGARVGALNGIAGLAHHIAILGNISEQAKEHSVRIFGTNKMVVGHNLLTGPATDGIRHDFKLMANGINEWPADNAIFRPGTTSETLPNTRYVRVHNNTIGRSGSPNTWHAQFAPQDSGRSGTVEGIRDVLLESNRFIDGNADNGLERGLQAFGRNITERGNDFPSSWSNPVQTTSYPSMYSANSSLYSAYWHGPYYIGDTVPRVVAPLRGGDGGVVEVSPPLAPVVSVSVTR